MTPRARLTGAEATYGLERRQAKLCSEQLTTFHDISGSPCYAIQPANTPGGEAKALHVNERSNSTRDTVGIVLAFDLTAHRSHVRRRANFEPRFLACHGDPGQGGKISDDVQRYSAQVGP